jgi:internalin A
MRITFPPAFFPAAALFSLLLLPPYAGADDLFPDKSLESAVRRQVFAKRDSDEPLTEEDVRNISTVDGKRKGIRNLKGLEACMSLAALDLEENEVSDLSPISELKRLQTITLKKNKIEDLKPLAGLSSLQYLQLEDNAVTDVTPLEKLEALNSLYLSNNKIEDVKPLTGLKKLWSLYLDNNQVTDIEPLAKLTRLDSLHLAGNKISDITPLANLTDLKFLDLQNNQIADLSTLVAMAKKDREGDNRFALFWRLYLSGNPFSNDAKTKQMEQLKELGGRVDFEEKQ